MCIAKYPTLYAVEKVCGVLQGLGPAASTRLTLIGAHERKHRVVVLVRYTPVGSSVWSGCPVLHFVPVRPAES